MAKSFPLAMPSQLLYTARVISKLRIVLICMIVLAMPVQGIAAATMRFCAPGGQWPAHHGAAAHAAHHHAAHAQAAAPSHHHHHHGQAVADATNDESNGGLGAMSKMKCSVCAVCCMAAAIAPDIPTVHVVENGSKVMLPVSVSYVGPVADGLERPPRSFLA
jgi:Na+-transporting methylmalonyl-CoA/oxaloacetate decarboxylase gamma subunit